MNQHYILFQITRHTVNCDTKFSFTTFSVSSVGRRMTRFARAVGSKASNKREEEEATPWSVMVAGVSSFVVQKSLKKYF